MHQYRRTAYRGRKLDSASRYLNLDGLGLGFTLVLHRYHELPTIDVFKPSHIGVLSLHMRRLRLFIGQLVILNRPT